MTGGSPEGYRFRAFRKAPPAEVVLVSCYSIVPSRDVPEAVWFQLTPAAHSCGVRQVRFFSALGCEQLESVTFVSGFENHRVRDRLPSPATVGEAAGSWLRCSSRKLGTGERLGACPRDGTFADPVVRRRRSKAMRGRGKGRRLTRKATSFCASCFTETNCVNERAPGRYVI